MERWLILIARAAAVSGVLICAVAAVVRLAGTYWLAGFQLGTLLLAGMAAMMVGCLCFLQVLAMRLKAP